MFTWTELFIFSLLHLQLVASDALRVCVVLDAGYEMLVDPAATPSEVQSDSELQGFMTDMRSIVLKEQLGLNYTITVSNSYPEGMVGARRGDCDLAWTAWFMFGSRERCHPDPISCRSLGELTTPLPSDLTPWRCCVDYSPPFMLTGEDGAEADPSPPSPRTPAHAPQPTRPNPPNPDIANLCPKLIATHRAWPP